MNIILNFWFILNFLSSGELLYFSFLLCELLLFYFYNIKIKDYNKIDKQTPMLKFFNKSLNKFFFFKYIFYYLLIILFVDLAALCIFSFKPITFISCVLISLLLIAVSVSAFSLLDRKIIAVIQRRRGPNVVGLWGSLQGIMDALKLIFKEIIYPSEAGIQLFLFAPIMTLSISLLG